MKMINSFLTALIIMSIMMLSGCGANFVAADKNLGLAPGAKPVVGVIIPYYQIDGNGSRGALVKLEFEKEIVGSLNDIGVEAKAIPVSAINSNQQLANAIKKYNALPPLKINVENGYEFGELGQDFKSLGIDMLVIISGNANSPSRSILIDAASIAAFGVLTPQSKSVINFVTAIKRDGKPIYCERTIYSRMMRNDFGDTGHRKSMASAIADDIKSKSF